MFLSAVATCIAEASSLFPLDSLLTTRRTVNLPLVERQTYHSANGKLTARRAVSNEVADKSNKAADKSERATMCVHVLTRRESKIVFPRCHFTRTFFVAEPEAAETWRK